MPPSLAGERNKLRIFLSYRSATQPLIDPLYQRLLNDGFDPWMDKQALLPGANWEARIAAAINDSDAMLICLSHHSADDLGYVEKEIAAALKTRREQITQGLFMIVPVRLDQCQIPANLREWQWAELFHESGYSRLHRSLLDQAQTIDPAFAIRVLDRSIEQHPGDIVSWLERGLNFLRLEQFDHAYQNYDHAVQLDADNVDGHIGRGIASSFLTEYRRAIKDFDLAIKLDSLAAGAFFERACTWGALKDKRRSLADFNTAIRLDPANARYYAGRANALAEEGSVQEAILDFTEAIRLEPKVSDGFYGRAMAYMQTDDFPSSLADWNNVIRLAPKHAEAYWRRSYVRGKVGDKPGAQEDYDSAKTLGYPV